MNITVENQSKKTELVLLFERNHGLEEDILILRKKWTGGNKLEDLETLEKHLTSSLEKWVSTRDDLLELRKKYNLSAVYDLVLEQAIGLGEIRIFNRVLYYAIPKFVLENLPEVTDEAVANGDYEHAFIVLPDANEEEVSFHINSMRNGLKKLTDTAIHKVKRPTSDTLKNIERDKEWYDQHKVGWSYAKIQTEYFNKNRKRITQSGVEKAIKAYAKRVGK